MKYRFVILVLVSAFAISCNHTKKKSSNKLDQELLKQDSITLISLEKEQIEQKKKDSIFLIEQNKVIGEILFGMTKIEVKQKIKKFRKESRRPDRFLGLPYYDYFIGEYEYFQITGFYDEEKLYELFIQGDLTDWENFDKDVPRQAKYISNVIEQKYGEPDLHYNIQQRYKLKKGYSYLISRWIVGKKTIEVRLKDNGTNYPINISIFLQKVRNKISIENAQKEKQSTEKSKDIF